MTKSRTLRKAGAVVLSLAMAFSVAGVAPSADAAAKTPALSAKKGTIKVGKKKTVKVKNTTAKKVKKLVVSSNKKAVATVKKNSKVKFTVTGKKVGTAKITAKVTLKKKVAGKKVYALKYTATVKKAATTPTEAPVVAVTGVTLSNSTPKVGDTISATVEPANATSLTYAWFSGDAATQVETAIEGATGASLSVTEALIGKYIKVVVNGEEGSSASATTTAPVTAAATDKIAIASAKQVGAAKIQAVFNKAVTTADYDITVSRGTTAQTVTVVLDEAGTTATITLGTALAAGEYTVKIVKKSDATENATATVTAEQAQLKSIDFVGDQLILTSSAMTKAAVSIKGVNQFDEDVALSGALTVYTTKGTAEYIQKDKKIVITCGTNIFFTTGEQVTVTAVYNNGNVPLQVSKALTVSNVATLTEFELGDVATTRAALKGKRVDLTNLATETYYFPVKKAKDQYGNDLSASDLDAMMVKGTADASKNLYITPAQADGAYAYVTGFTKLDDGTIAMNINKGSLGTPGKALFSITGVSGYSGTKELEIMDDPYIAELTVSAPNLYVGREAELTISAKDQYGDAVDLYSKTKDTPDAGEGITFTDKNNLTKGHSSIKFSDGLAGAVVKKDTSKKTVKFVYTPGTKGQTIVTVQSATPAVSNLTWTVDATPTVAGISGLKGTVKTEVAKSAAAIVDFSEKTNLTWLDSSGAAVKEANLGAITYKKNEAAVKASGAGLYYTVDAPTPEGIVALDADSGVLSGANNKLGAASVKVTLYEVKGTGTTTYSAIADKTFKFTVVGTAKSYTAAIAAGDSLLYVGPTSADSTGFTVKGVDENGNSIAFTNYNVTVDSDLKVEGQKVIGKVSGVGAKGTAVATIWVDGKAEATVDVPFDVAAPAPQKLNTTVDAFPTTAGLSINADGSATVKDATINPTAPNETKIFIADQYGLPMANTAWKIGGKDIGAGSLPSAGQYALTATSGKVSGSWTLTVSGAVTPTLASQAVKTASIVAAGGANELVWNDSTTGLDLVAKDSSGATVTDTDLSLLRVVGSDGKTNVAGKFVFTASGGNFKCAATTDVPAVGSYTATFANVALGDTIDWAFKVIGDDTTIPTFTAGSQKVTSIEIAKAMSSAHAGKVKVTVTTDEDLKNQPGTYYLYKVTTQPSASATTELTAANLYGSLTVAQDAADPEVSGELLFTNSANVTDGMSVTALATAEWAIVFVPNSAYYTGGTSGNGATLYSSISTGGTGATVEA